MKDSETWTFFIKLKFWIRIKGQSYETQIWQRFLYNNNSYMSMIGALTINLRYKNITIKDRLKNFMSRTILENLKTRTSSLPKFTWKTWPENKSAHDLLHEIVELYEIAAYTEDIEQLKELIRDQKILIINLWYKKGTIEGRLCLANSYLSNLCLSHLKNKIVLITLMPVSSHIWRVLIGVKYRNCC